VDRFTKQQEDALVLLTSLQYLNFSCFHTLLCLPAGLHRLSNLKTLEIFSCGSLRSLPEDGLPSSLQELIVRSTFINKVWNFFKRGTDELRMACINYTRDHPGIKLRMRI